jgi:hypothetical protein
MGILVFNKEQVTAYGKKGNHKENNAQLQVVIYNSGQAGQR